MQGSGSCDLSSILGGTVKKYFLFYLFCFSPGVSLHVSSCDLSSILGGTEKKNFLYLYFGPPSLISDHGMLVVCKTMICNNVQLPPVLGESAGR